MHAEQGILLDISRLIARLDGLPLTGIDRVEREWLLHLQDQPHLLLCRAFGAQLLLPPEAGAAILRWIDGAQGDLPAPGFLARLRGRTGVKDRALSALRGMALASERGTTRRLGRMAKTRLGGGAVYLNLGHANWRREVFNGLADLQRVVLIHDMIPLDHPEYTRAGQDVKFRDRFMIAAQGADLILTISQASAERIALWRKRLVVHRSAPVVVTPIGTQLAAPDARDLPASLDLSRPFFICLGTIEPRKNHALLLDAWARMAADHPDQPLPQLFIIGRRGWENHETFARLDRLPAGGPIVELNGLDDGAVAALMMRCHGLLMPSLAEGFGMPLAEAALRGIPVLATPLPSSKELLGDWARYLESDRPQLWADGIFTISAKPLQRVPALSVPDWPTHFRSVTGALPHLSE